MKRGPESNPNIEAPLLPAPQSLNGALEEVEITRIDLNGSKRYEQGKKTYSQLIAEQLGHYVLGQPAVNTVARRYAAASAGLSDPKRPYASILELGPTGVGKTELAKALARIRFGDEWESRTKVINCAEFTQDHTAQRFTGSPQGYVGAEEQSLIPHDWLHAGDSVIIFDEIGKAAGSVHRMVLSILEEGKLEARNGKEGFKPLNFNNAFIFFTSNVGAVEMSQAANGRPLGFIAPDNAARAKSIRKAAQEAMEKKFPPELINRFSDIEIFNPLGRETMPDIMAMMIRRKNGEIKQLFQEDPPTLRVTPEFRDHIVATVDLRYGARSLRTMLGKNFFNPSADVMLEEKTQGKWIVADYTPDTGIAFHIVTPPTIH